MKFVNEIGSQNSVILVITKCLEIATARVQTLFKYEKNIDIKYINKKKMLYIYNMLFYKFIINKYFSNFKKKNYY